MGASFSDPVPRGAVALAVTDWYIDPVRGKNSNFGTSATSPIRSFAEYLVRVGGAERTLNRRLTFHVLGDVPTTDPFSQAIRATSRDAYVEVRGEGLSVAYEGRLLTVRASDLVANTAAGIQDLGVANWTPYLGKLFRMTSGPYAGKGCAFFAKNEGGGWARLSSFVYPNTDGLNVDAFTPSVGETYEIVTPRTVAYLDLDVTGQGNLHPSLTLYNLKLSTPLAAGPGFYVDNIIAFFCDLPWVVVGNSFQANACRFSGLLATVQSANLVAYFPLIQTFAISLSGTLTLGGTSLVQAASPIAFGFDPPSANVVLHSSSGGVHLYDQAAPFFRMDGGASLFLVGKLAGKNNVGPTFSFQGGARAINGLTGFVVQSTTNGLGTYPMPGSYDLTLQGLTATPAFDTATNTYTTDRALTYPLLITSVAGGGFGGNAIERSSLVRITAR